MFDHDLKVKIADIVVYMVKYHVSGLERLLEKVAQHPQYSEFLPGVPSVYSDLEVELFEIAFERHQDAPYQNYYDDCPF